MNRLTTGFQGSGHPSHPGPGTRGGESGTRQEEVRPPFDMGRRVESRVPMSDTCGTPPKETRTRGWEGCATRGRGGVLGVDRVHESKDPTFNGGRRGTVGESKVEVPTKRKPPPATGPFRVEQRREGDRLWYLSLGTVPTRARKAGSQPLDTKSRPPTHPWSRLI